MRLEPSLIDRTLSDGCAGADASACAWVAVTQCISRESSFGSHRPHDQMPVIRQHAVRDQAQPDTAQALVEDRAETLDNHSGVGSSGVLRTLRLIT